MQSLVIALSYWSKSTSTCWDIICFEFAQEATWLLMLAVSPSYYVIWKLYFHNMWYDGHWYLKSMSRSRSKIRKHTWGNVNLKSQKHGRYIKIAAYLPMPRPRNADLRALLHHNKLLIKVIIIILTIYLQWTANKI